LNIFDTYKDFKPVRPKQVSKNHLVFGYEGILDTTDFEINLLSKAPDSFDYRITKRRDADTLDYWLNSYYDTDSLIFNFKYQDKADSLVLRTKDMEEDSLTIETKPKTSIGFEEAFYIRANLPLINIDTSKINIYDQDTLKVKYAAKLNTYHNQIKIQFDKNENSSYNLIALPNAVKDFYGHTNDTLKIGLKTKNRADFSLLDLTIRNLESYPAIVQLVDDKEKIEKSTVLTSNNRHTFEYVKPGTYFIKVIYDANNNGIWDSGNFLEQRQPEVIKYSKKSIELRANWDVVQSINLR